MSLKTISPTKEQLEFCRVLLKGGHTGGIAGPGAGKTTTLEYAAKALADKGKHGQLITYNKAISDKTAQSLADVPSVRVSTVHSFALRNALSARLLDKNRIGSLTTKDISGRCRGGFPIYPSIQKLYRNMTGKALENAFLLSSFDIATLVRGTLDTFFMSREHDLQEHHVDISGLQDRVKNTMAAISWLAPTPQQDPMTRALLNLNLHSAESLAIVREVLGRAQTIWDEMTNIKGELPIPHDAYLKMYVKALAEDRAKIPTDLDYLMFDEFQDANPPILEMAALAMSSGVQVIAVGDPLQHIYGFRGNVDGFEDLAFDHTVRLTKSFRFGPEIAELIQNYVRATMNRPEYVLVGDKSVKSCVDTGFHHYNAIICRTNGEILDECMRVASDKKIMSHGVYVPRTREILAVAQDVYALQDGKVPGGPLRSCRSLRELEEFLTEDRGGAGLDRLVKQVRAISRRDLFDLVSAFSSKDNKKLTLLTAHAAKGLEFPYVKISDKFADVYHKILHDENFCSEGGLTRDESISQEHRLLFVALSRAQYGLDPYSVKKLLTHVPPKRYGGGGKIVEAHVEKQQRALEKKAAKMAKEQQAVTVPEFEYGI